MYSVDYAFYFSLPIMASNVSVLHKRSARTLFWCKSLLDSDCLSHDSVSSISWTVLSPSDRAYLGYNSARSILALVPGSCFPTSCIAPWRKNPTHTLLPQALKLSVRRLSLTTEIVCGSPARTHPPYLAHAPASTSYTADLGCRISADERLQHLTSASTSPSSTAALRCEHSAHYKALQFAQIFRRRIVA